MTFPEFKSDILIVTEWPIPSLYISETFAKHFTNTKLSIEINQRTEEKNYSRTEWISTSSMLNIYFSDSFISNHFSSKGQELTLLYEKFKMLIMPLVRISSASKAVELDKVKRTRPFATLSTFYKTKDGFILQFLFEIAGEESEYEKALIASFEVIALYNQETDNEIKLSVKKSYSQSNKIKYLLFTEGKWVVLNPLFEIGKEINEKYKANKDFRIQKPFVIVHRDDFRKYFILDNNWVLNISNLETLMIKPNDVSLYSSISDKHLRQAKAFYEQTILPRFESYHGAYPSLVKQTEYYDYFELIIAALIFGYTALEAFANICIPNSFEYLVDGNGFKTIYSKEGIERKFPLRDKFKKILPAIIKAPDPSKEKWWAQFIVLEDLRNEVIHTKQSKSEERYSKLLAKEIFEVVTIHKDIIKFYGSFISENRKELLDEFPYGFGHDDFFPGLTDDEGYRESYKTLFNTDDNR